MSLSPTVGAPTHPALLQQARERQSKFENRIVAQDRPPGVLVSLRRDR
jgi:hypothetical protein